LSQPIRILPRAKADFRTILSYIEEHSPAGATSWREAFEQSLRRLSGNAERFGLAAEDNLTEFVVRKLLFKTPYGVNYRMVFTVYEGDILILRVRGPGQPPLRAEEISLH
jgi:plasmid stabilization system protein ParE